MKTTIIAAVALAGAGLIGGSAMAQAPLDGVTVFVPGSEVVQFQSFSESNEFFIGLTVLPTGFNGGTVFLTEPGSDAISDVLTITTNTTGGVDIFFFSDPAAVPPEDILPRQLRVEETGQYQDVSAFFDQPTGFAQVVSDLNAVPEPAAWTLMILGFAGVGGMARRQARKTAYA